MANENHEAWLSRLEQKINALDQKVARLQSAQTQQLKSRAHHHFLDGQITGDQEEHVGLMS